MVDVPLQQAASTGIEKTAAVMATLAVQIENELPGNYINKVSALRSVI